MFDIGFSELVVIALVALVVLGPERLPRAARFAGLWVRRARAHWYSVKSELEQELAADELRRSLRETKDALRDAGEALRDPLPRQPQQPELQSTPATGEDDGERRD
jgi:sec-independent protein translocase protein TatB